jgi:hypothetical protein
MFGSVRAIGPGDLVRILQLPAEDRRYFIDRWSRSLRSHLGGVISGEDGAAAPLGDLRLLSFRMASRVTVTLKSGRQLSAERIIPTGMAGDPNRGSMVQAKLRAEGEPVLGGPRCDALWQAIGNVERMPRVRLAQLASNHKGEPYEVATHR